MRSKKTIKDVAKLAGVSVGTASNVVNGRGNVDANLCKKVMKAVAELNYRTNGIARSLRSSSSYTLAVLLGDITNPFQMTMARGIEEISYENNYHLLISSTKEDPEIERNYLRMFYEKRVDGIILCTTGKVNDEINNLLQHNVPIVLVDRPVSSLDLDVVADDNLLGMDLLVRHLYEYGHRRIGVINGDESTIHGHMRSQGVINAFEKYRLELPSELHLSGSFSYSSGYEAVSHFFSLEEPPTAILSVNNNITAGVLRACRDQNIDIPKQVSVVGFGDLEYSWNLIVPSVTVVTQSPLLLGRKAATLLLNRLTLTEVQPRTHLFFTPELIVRESSALFNNTL